MTDQVKHHEKIEVTIYYDDPDCDSRISKIMRFIPSSKFAEIFLAACEIFEAYPPEDYELIFWDSINDEDHMMELFSMSEEISPEKTIGNEIKHKLSKFARTSELMLKEKLIKNDKFLQEFNRVYLVQNINSRVIINSDFHYMFEGKTNATMRDLKVDIKERFELKKELSKITIATRYEGKEEENFKYKIQSLICDDLVLVFNNEILKSINCAIYFSEDLEEEELLKIIKDITTNIWGFQGYIPLRISQRLSKNLDGLSKEPLTHKHMHNDAQIDFINTYRSDHFYQSGFDRMASIYFDNPEEYFFRIDLLDKKDVQETENDDDFEDENVEGRLSREDSDEEHMAANEDEEKEKDEKKDVKKKVCF